MSVPDNLAYCRLVEILDTTTDGVREQVLGEIAQERERPIHQYAIQITWRRKLGPVVIRAASIQRHTIFTNPPAARHIEVVERETDRVHHPMTRVTGRVGAVNLHPLARGQPSSVRGALGLFKGGDVGRRRWWW